MNVNLASQILRISMFVWLINMERFTWYESSCPSSVPFYQPVSALNIHIYNYLDD